MPLREIVSVLLNEFSGRSLPSRRLLRSRRGERGNSFLVCTPCPKSSHLIEQRNCLVFSGETGELCILCLENASESQCVTIVTVKPIQVSVSAVLAQTER